MWRSIWNARRLRVEGLVWKVGDESKIIIWTDMLVPTTTASFIQSLLRILKQDATVNELLDKETNWWNTTLVHEVFSAEEAGLICSMAVCPCRGEDRLVWASNKNGEYTVRSAYHIAKERFEV